MKERPVDRERAVIAHHQAAKVAEPGVGAFDDPTALVPPQRSAILCRGFLAVRAMRRDQFDSAPRQPLAQRIAVVGFVGDHPHRLLPGTPGTMTPAYAPQNPENPFQHTAVLDPRAATLAMLARFGKQGSNFLPLHFRQQRTLSGHRPSLGAAGSAYLSSEKTQLPSFQEPVLGYAT